MKNIIKKIKETKMIEYYWAEPITERERHFIEIFNTSIREQNDKIDEIIKLLEEIK